MTIRDFDAPRISRPAERLWEPKRARSTPVLARRHPRMTTVVVDAPATVAWDDRALSGAIAALVVAQATVVGLQVIGRHVFRQPIPWTEEIARLLLAWLMCVGGVSALRHGAASARHRIAAPAVRDRTSGDRSRTATGPARVLSHAWSFRRGT